VTRSRTWYLVRHGETEWNADARMQGRLDSRLSAIGRAQAARTGEVMARLGVDHVFASPLGRVRETLALFAPHLPIAPVFDDRLMEWSAGAWAGRRYADLRIEASAEFAAWEADRYRVRAPGGENFADLERRARAFFADAAAVPHERIAVVAHGFMNRALAACLLALSPDETLAIRQDNDTIFRIRTADGTTVADHFAAGEGPFPGLTDRPDRLTPATA
jgi:broad specificity phosphatase PhoE